MRKLLLVMLIPILVLGVMGCGKKIDAGVQTDEKIQGAWIDEAGSYSLYVSAAQTSVKYMTDVVTPYRTEFNYAGSNAANQNRYFAALPSTAAWTGIVPGLTVGKGILGVMTLFGYKDNTEIATVYLGYEPGAEGEEGEEGTGAVLNVYKVVYAEPEYYYANAMPKVGSYSNMYEAVAGGEDDAGPKAPVPGDFTVNLTTGAVTAKAGKTGGTIDLKGYAVAGAGGKALADWDAVFAEGPGDYVAKISVAEDPDKYTAKDLEIPFTLTPAAWLGLYPGGLTTGISTQGDVGVAFQADGAGVITLGKAAGAGGSSLFILPLPSATAIAGTKSIKITYVCVKEAGDAKLILKNGAWGSIAVANGTDGCNWYPSLTSDGTEAVLSIAEKYYTDATDSISFQANDDGNDTAIFYLKILSVVLE